MCSFGLDICRSVVLKKNNNNNLRFEKMNFKFTIKHLVKPMKNCCFYPFECLDNIDLFSLKEKYNIGLKLLFQVQITKRT